MTKIEADKLAKQYRAAIADIQSWIPAHTISEKLLAWFAQEAPPPWPSPEGFPLSGEKESELHAAYWRALKTFLGEVADESFSELLKRQAGASEEIEH